MTVYTKGDNSQPFDHRPLSVNSEGILLPIEKASVISLASSLKHCPKQRAIASCRLKIGGCCGCAKVPQIPRPFFFGGVFLIYFFLFYLEASETMYACKRHCKPRNLDDVFVNILKHRQ
jgi:hypothetical protein